MCCSSFSLSPFCSWSLTTVSTISLLWLTMTNSPRLGLNSFPTSIQPCKFGSISQWTHTSPSKTTHFFFLATGRSLCIQHHHESYEVVSIVEQRLDGMLIHYMDIRLIFTKTTGHLFSADFSNLHSTISKVRVEIKL